MFSSNTAAKNHGAFWLGGPDFAIEIVSPDDQTREKLDFYAKVATRELPVVDRFPWQLELYRLQGSTLLVCQRDAPETSFEIDIESCSLRAELQPSAGRPRIVISQHGGDKTWTIRS